MPTPFSFTVLSVMVLLSEEVKKIPTRSFEFTVLLITWLLFEFKVSVIPCWLFEFAVLLTMILFELEYR